MYCQPLFPGLYDKGEGTKNNPTRSSVRQEVLNVLLAQLLHERGLEVVPEQIIKEPSGFRRMPDVIVDFQGLRLAIEGEFASRTAHEKASRSAKQRVEDGIAHMGIALVYPSALREMGRSIDELKTSLASARLEFAIITENEATPQESLFPLVVRAPAQFVKGELDDLAEELRKSYERLIQDRVLERAVKFLDQGIEVFVGSLNPQPACTSRFASALGIRELPKGKRKDTEKEAE
jgi:hypothetical protein